MVNHNPRFLTIFIHIICLTLVSGVAAQLSASEPKINRLGLNFRIIISQGGVFPVSIHSVNPGSMAEKSGFQSGDRIYRINNVEVTPANFFSVLNSFPPGSKATFQVTRNNKVMYIKTTLPGKDKQLSSQFDQDDTEPNKKIIQAKILNRIYPEYPEIAKKQGIHGKVAVTLYIGETGEMKYLQLLQSPHPILFQSVKNAIRQWKFSPAKQNGYPVGSFITITVNFKPE